MKTAIVIPVGAGREDNLRRCMESIAALEPRGPEYTVIVLDGDVDFDHKLMPDIPFYVVESAKHEPGMEQPRNIGVRHVEEINRKNAMLRQGYPVTHVWFLDSDIIVTPSALNNYEIAATDEQTPRIMVGPYEWLPEGETEERPDLHNDQRWQSFRDNLPTTMFRNDLSAGLACFSGNLVWPIDQFTRVGGFWNEIHHGRCEDGELGLRAVACDVPISFVGGARGYHISHPINMELILERNERDVPMLNERHPWVEGEGLFVVEEDGKRFNVRCPCGWEGNTAEIWEHKARCPRETECLSCGEGNPRDECPNSKRACGHHCNCSWTNDHCHWCDKEFGES